MESTHVNIAKKDEQKLQSLNVLFATLIALLGLFFSDFNSGAAVLGSIYTIANTRIFFILTGALVEGGAASKPLLIVLAALKLPILMLLIYLAYLQGIPFILSALTGTLIIIPTGLCFALLRASEQKAAD